MDNPITALSGQIRNFWSTTTRQQRLQFIAILVISLAVLTALLWFAFRVELSPAFTNVEAAEAGTIKSHLDSKNIPVEILSEPDGQYTILVPRAQVSSLQLEISAAGLLVESNDVLDTLPDNSMFLSESERTLREQTGRERQISSAIQTIKGVQSAKVILNIVKTPTTLRPQNAESTASIVVVLATGVQLDDDRITGILNLVSRGVPNLLKKNISIIDQNGNPLYDLEIGLSSGVSSSRIADLEEMLSQALKRWLTRDLEQMFGAGNAVVTVRVGLNSDSKESTQKTVSGPDPENPSEGILISEKSIESNAYGSASGGVPGTASNIPNSAATTTINAEDQGSMYREWTRNYEVSELLETHQIKPGDIRQVAGTVTLNSRGIKTPINEATLTAVADIARAGLGIQDVKVYALDFEPAYDLEALQAERNFETYRNIAYAVLAVIALAVILVFVWRYLATRRRRLAEEEAEMVRQLAMQQEVHLPENQLSVQDKQRMQIMEELNRLALNNPEEFAKLMTAWMEEG